MKIQVPKAVGVFAEDTKLLVTDSHALLTFLQVFDIDKSAKTVLAQVAAQVYSRLRKLADCTRSSAKP